MEDFRSKSYADGRTTQQQIADHSYGDGPAAYGINGMQDLRCYSASYATTVRGGQTQTQNGFKMKKGKSTNLSSKNWSLTDPEMQRKKRVASYKVYAVEGKVKGSLKKGFRWLKDRCSRVVYGW